jgi:hypothetical protein
MSLHESTKRIIHEIRYRKANLGTALWLKDLVKPLSEDERLEILMVLLIGAYERKGSASLFTEIDGPWLPKQKDLNHASV